MSLKSVLPNPVHHAFDRDDEQSTVKGELSAKNKQTFIHLYSFDFQ